MSFLQAFTRGIQILPYLINGVESIFGKGNGKSKQEKVIEK